MNIIYFNEESRIAHDKIISAKRKEQLINKVINKVLIGACALGLLVAVTFLITI
jgi:hypothetical protein